MTETEIDEKAAVEWCEGLLASKYFGGAVAHNAARAALRWREDLAKAQARITTIEANHRAILETLGAEATKQVDELKARIVELEQSARAYEHEVMTGRNEQHDRLVAERDRLKERIAELEAERDAAIHGFGRAIIARREGRR